MLTNQLLVGAFSVIVKLCVIFGNLRLKLYWGHLPVPGDTAPPAPGGSTTGPLDIRKVLLPHDF